MTIVLHEMHFKVFLGTKGSRTAIAAELLLFLHDDHVTEVNEDHQNPRRLKGA
jgi:hypothetical protein